MEFQNWQIISAIVSAFFTIVIAVLAFIFGRIKNTVKVDIGFTTEGLNKNHPDIKPIRIDITNIHQRPTIIREIELCSKHLDTVFEIKPSRVSRTDELPKN